MGANAQHRRLLPAIVLEGRTPSQFLSLSSQQALIFIQSLLFLWLGRLLGLVLGGQV